MEIDTLLQLGYPRNLLGRRVDQEFVDQITRCANPLADQLHEKIKSTNYPEWFGGLCDAALSCYLAKDGSTLKPTISYETSQIPAAYILRGSLGRFGDWPKPRLKGYPESETSTIAVATKKQDIIDVLIGATRHSIFSQRILRNLLLYKGDYDREEDIQSAISRFREARSTNISETDQHLITPAYIAGWIDAGKIGINICPERNPSNTEQLTFRPMITFGYRNGLGAQISRLYGGSLRPDGTAIISKAEFVLYFCEDVAPHLVTRPEVAVLHALSTEKLTRIARDEGQVHLAADETVGYDCYTAFCELTGAKAASLEELKQNLIISAEVS